MAIVSYLLIILKGQMIGLPFFLWLGYTLFDFGNIDQLFAFFAAAGIFLSVVSLRKRPAFMMLALDTVSFVLMLSPLIFRLAAVPVRLFYYGAFILPSALFILSSLASLLLLLRQCVQPRMKSNEPKR